MSRIIILQAWGYTREQMDVFLNNPYIDHLWYCNRFVQKSFFPVLAIFGVIPRRLLSPPDWILDRSNIKDLIADVFSLNLDDKHVDIFLTDDEKSWAQALTSNYKNPILLHVHSRSSRHHNWPIDRWERLIQLLPDFTFIQTGLSDDPSVRGVVDLRGKTSLRQMFSLAKYVKAFVGIESVVAHVTNAFNIPGVVLFGDSSPTLWGHTNNINIYKNLSCSPCFSILQGKGDCPFGHECMVSITISEVRDALLKQMEVKAPD
jgi:ADP-heptose:LPS heptosyltransferase